MNTLLYTGICKHQDYLDIHPKKAMAHMVDLREGHPTLRSLGYVGFLPVDFGFLEGGMEGGREEFRLVEPDADRERVTGPGLKVWPGMTSFEAGGIVLATSSERRPGGG
jgi:hypothetical protein